MMARENINMHVLEIVQALTQWVLPHKLQNWIARYIALIKVPFL